jgi:hypothetical protein
VAFRLLNQSFEKRLTDSASTRRCCHINGNFRHTSIDVASRDRTQRGPAEYLIVDGNQAAILAMAFIPFLPVRNSVSKVAFPEAIPSA